MRRLQHLREIDEVALTPRDLESILAVILERVSSYFAGDAAALLLAEGGRLRLASGFGVLAAEVARGAEVAIGRGAESTVLQGDGPLVIDRVETLALGAAVLGAAGVTTVLAVPLQVGMRRLGVLEVGLCGRRQFAPEDIAFFQLVADRVAIAVEQARITDELRRSSERRRRWQTVTTRIAQATSEQAIAQALVDGVDRPADADAAVVYFSDGAGLRLAAHAGLADEQVARLARVPLDSPLPLAEACRRAVPMYFETREELLRDYPALGQGPPQRLAAVAAVPLSAGDEVLGAMALSYRRPHRFDAEERDAFMALAQSSALALSRMRLLAAERRAREQAEAANAELRDHARRLEFLARVGVELDRSLDYAQTLAAVARLAVPTMADWCAVDLVEGGVRQRVAVAHVDPAKLAFVAELERRYPPDPDARSGVPEILRTGRPEMLAEIPRAVLDAAARDEQHRELIHRLGLRSYIGVPLRRGEQIIGVITLVMAESERRYDEQDLALALAMADRAAVAVENARLFLDNQRARQRAEQAREAIEASERRFRTLAEQTATMVWTWRQGGEIELHGDGWRRFSGRAATTESTAVSWLHLHPEDAMAVQVGWEAAITSETPWRAEYRLRRQDGVYVPVESYAVPVRGPGGVVREWIGATTDISARKAAEEERARFLEASERARAAAEAASRTKDEFLAMLGHELRNPLAPIVTALELTRRRGDEVLRKEQRVIERQVEHLARLVDDLLDVSRVATGKIELRRAPAELGTILAKAIEMASPLFEQRGHELSVNVPAGLHVDADETRLAQVFANILTNAAKYTEPGGHVRLDARREGGEVVVAVRDDGIGLEPELAPRIFDSFVQGRPARRSGSSGLGLGLALVRSLTELHGGTVSAHSDGPGRGSEFVVRLPALAGAELGPPRRTPVSLAPGDGQRVLLVDDNVDAAEMLGELLRRAGHDVEIAHDGPDALEAARRRAFDVAILDIGLPVMDGYELAAALRDAGRAPPVLLALTGYGQDHDRARSAMAGFAAHFVKPIDPQQLLRALARPRPAAAG